MPVPFGLHVGFLHGIHFGEEKCAQARLSSTVLCSAVWLWGSEEWPGEDNQPVTSYVPKCVFHPDTCAEC